MKLHQILIFLTLIYNTCSLLVNKNTDWGTKQLPGDDESLPIVLNQQIPIGSTSYQTFYVCILFKRYKAVIYQIFWEYLINVLHN